jgi:lipopolysaccharide transport system permease protein
VTLAAAQPQGTDSEPAALAPAAPSPVLELTGERTPVRLLVRDLIRRRHLLPMLASRDFRARYRSASLGTAWAVLLPLFQGTVLAIVFSQLVRISTRTNYAAFVMVGMMSWTYLTSSVQLSASSIVDQSDVAGRVYFPRLFLPGMAVLSNAPALAIGLLTVIPISLILGVDPTPRLFALPLAVGLAIVVAYSFGAPLALLNVYYRDVRYLLIAALQALMYGSPVIYPLSMLGHLRNLMAINPATGVIELSRWSFNANNGDPLMVPILGSIGWVVILAFVTAFAYSKHERLACDRL